MKVRAGFVSNSSSSSFIVITKHNEPERRNGHAKYIIGEKGVTEFGWEKQRLHDSASKINFAYLQIVPRGRYDRWTMLQDCIKKYTGALNVYVDDTFAENGYIDHASMGGRCTKMFESEDALARFLFSNASFVQTQSDNEEGEDDPDEFEHI